MKTYYLYLLAFVAISCKNKENHLPGILVSDSVYEQEIIHTDTCYKYQQRTGLSGNYEYTYNVIGIDNEGNEVTGSIAVNGESGLGTITDTNGNELNVEVNWIGYGILEAVDEDGNTYELRITE